MVDRVEEAAGKKAIWIRKLPGVRNVGSLKSDSLQLAADNEVVENGLRPAGQ
jgi:hypothetical protein